MTITRSQRDEALLRRILKGSPSRNERREAQLKQLTPFKEDAYDFPPEMIPFAGDARYEAAPEDTRRKICTRAWLAYNRKAVLLEERVVGPACITLGQDRIMGLPSLSRESVHEVFSEESRHITMLAQANSLTYSFRKLDGLPLPLPDLVRNMIRGMDKADRVYDAQMWAIVCAIVAEVSISDYLGQFNVDDDRIQEVNRELTALHRRDELAHAGVFSHLARLLDAEVESRNKYHDMLRKASDWFNSNEWHSWETILERHPFPGWRQMLEEKRRESCDMRYEVAFERMMGRLKLVA